jgi:23S rRNA (uridine2552-2'-O)-methyltransferase
VARRHNPYGRPDHFTRDAKQRGFPARSVVKLEEIDRRVRLLRSGQHVLDLGAAPGSWAMYAASRIGDHGKLLAVDLNPLSAALPPYAVVRVADLRDPDLHDLCMFAPYDVVLSDMAPKTSGTREADQARSFDLFMRALDIASDLLKAGGSFVGKIFMGPQFPDAKRAVKARFSTERTIRPEATRDCSFEIFLVGLGRIGPPRA